MSINEKADRMCRACLSTNESYSAFISLFSGGCAISQVPRKMMNLADVSVRKDDGLPDLICQKCIFLIKVADCFKKQLRMADAQLRASRTRDAVHGLSDVKTCADNNDTEMEDLAYNPEYISDGVKAKVEKAFGRKHRALRYQEFQKMSDFLKNLEKKGSSTNFSGTIESEISVGRIRRPAADDSENKEEKGKNRVESIATENSETAVEEKQGKMDNNDDDDDDDYDDDDIIVISDSSDDEGKMLLKAREETLALHPRAGEKRKIKAGPLVQKAVVVTGMPKIRVKKILQKIDSKIVPRTYFLCTSCNVRLQSVAAVLLHHSEVHSPTKGSLHCHMCNETFPTKTQFLAHLDRHAETHLFRCSYCPDEYLLKENLARHMLDMHTKHKPLEPENKRLKASNGNSTEGQNVETPRKQWAKGDEDSDKENVIKQGEAAY